MITEGGLRGNPDGWQGRRRSISNLELVFGFTDRAFNEYISLERTKDILPSQLQSLSSEMSRHSHPIVMYAGGWAAAEASMLRMKDNNPTYKDVDYSVSDRLQSLTNAQNMWLTAAEELHVLHGNTEDPKVSADLLGFELRAMQAISYLPSMRLISHLMGDQDISEQERDGYLRDTKQRVLSLSDVVIDLPGEDSEFLKVRSGVCNELLSGIFLQSDHDPQFIIIPASVRQDNNASGGRRSDLVAVATVPPHPKTLIQVSSGDIESSGMRFVVQAERDLTIAGKRSRSTLREVIKREKDTSSQQSTMVSQLDLASIALRDKFVTYVGKK